LTRSLEELFGKHTSYEVPHGTSSLLGPNILKTVFSNTFKPCHFLSVRHPYKKETATNIDLCILTLTAMLCGPCLHGTARPRVSDEGNRLQIWRVAPNILNKQS